MSKLPITLMQFDALNPSPTDKDILDHWQAPIFILDYLDERGLSQRVTALRAAELDSFVAELESVHAMRVMFVLQPSVILLLDYVWPGKWQMVEDAPQLFDDDNPPPIVTGPHDLNPIDTVAAVREVTRKLIYSKEPEAELTGLVEGAIKTALGRYKYRIYGERFSRRFERTVDAWKRSDRPDIFRPPFLTLERVATGVSEEGHSNTGVEVLELPKLYASIHPSLRSQAQNLRDAVSEGLENGEPLVFRSILQWSTSHGILPVEYHSTLPWLDALADRIKQRKGEA